MHIVSADGQEAEVPPKLGELLIKYRDWQAADGSYQPEPPTHTSRLGATEDDADIDSEYAAAGLDAATCDDDLPDGVVFADSAYTTTVDKQTGEKVRVLKTHCRNKHLYTPDSVKIRIRAGKATRECQNCLVGRKARAAEKKTSQKTRT